MPGSAEDQWADALWDTVSTPDPASPDIPVPALSAVAPALSLLWTVAATVEADSGAAELWWLRVAEETALVADGLLLVPNRAAGAAAIDPRQRPQQPLADTVQLRVAAIRTLVKTHDALALNAHDTHNTYFERAADELIPLLTEPITIAGPAEAVAAAKARTLIYAAAADFTAAALSRLPVADRLAGPARRLHADLSASVDATWAVLDLPDAPRTHATARTLTRVADHAQSSATVLLAHPDSNMLLDIHHPYRWLTRAAVLAGCMAELDTKLEPAMLVTAAHPATPTATATLLRSWVAVDCHTIIELGVADNAVTMMEDSILPSDPATPTVSITQPPEQLSTVHAPAALTDYLTWLDQHAADLTINDLTALTSTAARLTTLAGATGTLPPDTCRDTVRAWRRSYQHVTELSTSAHERPTGYGQPYRLSQWVEQHRRDHQGLQPPDHPQHTTAAILDSLPHLATAGDTALRHIHNRGEIHDLSIDHQPAGGHTADPTTTLAESRPVRPVSLPTDSTAFTAALHAFADAHDVSTALRLTTATTITPATPTTHSAATSPASGYLPPHRGLDVRWASWSDHTIAAERTRHRHISTRDELGRPTSTPAPEPTQTEQRILDILTDAAGQDYARAVRADPAWPSLLATVENLHIHGQDFTTPLTEAATTPHLDNGMPGAVLAGRLRRTTALPDDLPPATPHDPDQHSAKPDPTWPDSWNPYNDPTWPGPEHGLDP